MRQKKNATIGRVFDRIVATRIDRVTGMQQICEYGYDAKDFLIAKCRTVNDDPNVLAVQYVGDTFRLKLNMLTGPQALCRGHSWQYT